MSALVTNSPGPSPSPSVSSDEVKSAEAENFRFPEDSAVIRTYLLGHKLLKGPTFFGEGNVAEKMSTRLSGRSLPEQHIKLLIRNLLTEIHCPDMYCGLVGVSIMLAIRDYMRQR